MEPRKSLCLLFLLSLLFSVSANNEEKQHERQRRRQKAIAGTKTAPPSSLYTDAIPTTPGVRIVGGQLADRDEYPFFVHLGLGCGGSLITRDIVLTAAHCAETHDLGINAIISAYDEWAWNDNLTSPIVRYITDRRIHPDYNEFTDTPDIMIYKLNAPAPESIQPVRLNSDFAIPEDGQLITVIGFGDTLYDGEAAEILREVDLHKLELDMCNKNDFVDDSQNFCAGFLEDGQHTGGKDSCQGDSGGPLFIKDGTNVPIQVGVVSHGVECALQEYPGINARVSSSYDWIQRNACELSLVDSELCGDIGVEKDDDSCEAGESEFLFKLRTDDFGHETGWILRGPDGTILDNVGFEQYESELEHTIKRCLQPDSCYKLQIIDSHGDGIMQGGRYTVQVDGVIIKTSINENFGEETTINFCTAKQDGVDDGGGGNDDECISVQLEVNTDSRPRQTKVFMFDADSRESDYLWEHRGFPEKRSKYSMEACVPRDRCTYLDIHDRKGLDGNGVTLFVDGRNWYSGNIDSGVEQFNIGIC